nr:methyltransferase domain-containing protein [Streptomyces sp. SAI-144]
MDAVLRPRPGERILEIGPGTGLQSLHVAPQLGPEGRLDVLDIQQEMLDHVMCRAERDGLATIRPTRSDAHELPWPRVDSSAACRPPGCCRRRCRRCRRSPPAPVPAARSAPPCQGRRGFRRNGHIGLPCEIRAPELTRSRDRCCCDCHVQQLRHLRHDPWGAEVPLASPTPPRCPPRRTPATTDVSEDRKVERS